MNIKKIKKLIISGGGVKGYLMLGSLKYLEENNIINNIDTFIGISISSILIILIIIGIKVDEIQTILLNINIENILDDYNLENLLNNYGLIKGDKWIKIIEVIFLKKNIDKNITFKDIKDIYNKNFIVTGCNLNKMKTIYFSYENYPNMKIIDALRISISIPGIFTAVKYENDLYIDGGYIDPMPINTLLTNNNKDEILGIAVQDFTDINNINLSINNFQDYIYILLQSVRYKLYYDNLINFENNIIELIDDTNCIDYNISIDRKINMYNIGYNTTIIYFYNNYHKKKLTISNYCNKNVNLKKKTIINNTSLANLINNVPKNKKFKIYKKNEIFIKEFNNNIVNNKYLIGKYN